MTKLKLTTIGNSTGVILPKEILERLHVDKGDARFQDILVCIQTNTNVKDEKRLKMEAESYYLKSPDEMVALFPELPDAAANTQCIAEMCDLELDFSQLRMPEFRDSRRRDAAPASKGGWEGLCGCCR